MQRVRVLLQRENARHIERQPVGDVIQPELRQQAATERRCQPGTQRSGPIPLQLRHGAVGFGGRQRPAHERFPRLHQFGRHAERLANLQLGQAAQIRPGHLVDVVANGHDVVPAM